MELEDLLALLPKNERERLLAAGALQNRLLRLYVALHQEVTTRTLTALRTLTDPSGKPRQSALSVQQNRALTKFLENRVGKIDKALAEALKAHADPLADLVARQIAQEFKVLSLDQVGTPDPLLIEHHLTGAATRITSWNKDYTHDVVDVLRRGLLQGETYRDLADRVARTQAPSPIATARAHMLANTRFAVVSAANAARQESYIQSADSTGVRVQKMWWSAIGTCCVNCALLHGQIVDLSDQFEWEHLNLSISPFNDALLHPPLHPNCRCRVLPVTADLLNVIDLRDIRRQRQQRLATIKKAA